jgi:predicted nucleotidyltransferase
MRHYSASNAARTLGFLSKYYPQYILNSRVLSTRFSAVPRASIQEHFRPEEKAEEVLHSSGRDRLEEIATSLIGLLSERSNVDPRFIGITGSILLGIHRLDWSDIDLTVYGKDNCLKVREALLTLFEEGRGIVKRFAGKTLANWCMEQASTHALRFREAKALYQRKWSFGTYKERRFSISPVKLEEEVFERFGEHRYIPVGIVEGKVHVSSSSDSIFLPGTYALRDSQISTKQGTYEVREIVTYESLYSDIVSDGETAAVRGKLEKVLSGEGETLFYRVLVGSSEAQGSDYVRPLSLLG